MWATMPKLNMSTFVVYLTLLSSVLCIIYGAIYPIVPHLLKLSIGVCSLMNRANPKSISFGLNVEVSTIIFWGFISRSAIPLECK